jgi:hypothetical protein
MGVFKIRVKRNIYVKGYEHFPYQKLTGKHYLYYSGDIIYYKNDLPIGYNSDDDFAFDCECEYEEWAKIKKINKI